MKANVSALSLSPSPRSSPSFPTPSPLSHESSRSASSASGFWSFPGGAFASRQIVSFLRSFDSSFLLLSPFSLLSSSLLCLHQRSTWPTTSSFQNRLTLRSGSGSGTSPISFPLCANLLVALATNPALHPGFAPSAVFSVHCSGASVFAG